MANNDSSNIPDSAQPHSEEPPKFPRPEFFSPDDLRDELERGIRFTGEPRMMGVKMDTMAIVFNLGDGPGGFRIANWKEVLNDPPSLERLGGVLFLSQLMLEYYTLLGSLMASRDALDDIPDCRLIEWRGIAAEIIRDYLPHVRDEETPNIKALCDHVIDAANVALEAKRRELITLIDHKAPTGHVYLIESPSEAYKIGKAKDPRNRMKTFGVQLPFEVKFEAILPSNNMHVLESALHDFYRTRRLNGEWFALDDNDIAFFKSLAVQS